jgi:hypothetical protein
MWWRIRRTRTAKGGWERMERLRVDGYPEKAQP